MAVGILESFYPSVLSSPSHSFRDFCCQLTDPLCQRDGKRGGASTGGQDGSLKEGPIHSLFRKHFHSFFETLDQAFSLLF